MPFAPAPSPAPRRSGRPAGLARRCRAAGLALLVAALPLSQARHARAAASPTGRAAETAEPSVIRPAVRAALDAAARSTGADPALLYAMAWGESRYDPEARNRRSSARGLMQFTRATWLEMVRDAGHRHGLAREAAGLRTDPRDGAIGAPDAASLAALLARRDDPRLSAALAAERLLRGRAGLERALGRPAGAVDLYFMHLLGPAGAARFLSARAHTPARPAGEFVGRAGVRANAGVFAAPGRGALSLAEVHSGVGRRLAERGRADAAPPAGAEAVVVAALR